MNMVGDIYQSVIDDVIAKVAPDFEHESVPDTVLNELKRLWEEKLRQSAVLPQGMNQLMYSQHAYDQSYGSRAMLNPGFMHYTGLPNVGWKPPQNDGPLDDLEEANLGSHFDLQGNENSDDGDTLEGEEPLGSDLDDDAVEPETTELVLCQFEKVSRVKTKHKCQLKDGIMHLNGKDYLFSKATCEFEFYYNLKIVEFFSMFYIQ